MKKLILFLILFSLAVFAAAPKKFTNDVLQFGGGSNGSIKELIFDTGAGTNPSIRANSGDGSLLLRPNDVSLGDGAASDKTLSFDVGAGANNPKLFWDNAAGALSFSNDGTLIKKIGSGSGSGGSGGVNLLSNSSFEDPGSPILNWTNSGGTLTQEAHTNGREDNLNYARFVATGAAQYVESDTVTVSDDLGFGCMADVKYNQGDNAFTLKVLKEDLPGNPGTFIDVASGDFSDLTAFLKAPTVTFPCEGGDVFKLRFESTGAGTIDLEDAYLGSNKNISPVGKGAHFVGSIEWQPTASCQWVDGSTSYIGGYGPDNDCDDNPRIITGNITDYQAGLRPDFQINFMRKGHYQIVATGIFQDNTGGVTGTQISHRLNVNGGQFISQDMSFFDNTFGGSPVKVFSINTDQDLTNAQIVLESKTSNSSDAAIIEAADNSFKYDVYYFPTSNETEPAFSPEQADFAYEGYIRIGSSPGNSFALSTVIGEYLINSTFELFNQRGFANIACNNNPSSGTTCGGQEQAGINIDLPIAGQYEVCFDFSARPQGMSQLGSFQVVRRENATNAIIKRGNKMVQIYSNASQETTSSYRMCENFDIDSVGESTFSLEFAKPDGIVNVEFFEPDLTATRGASFSISVKLVKNDVATPRLLNQVSTRARLGSEKGACIVINNGTASFDALDPDCWILDSVSRASLGNVDISFSSAGFKCGTTALEGNRHVDLFQVGGSGINSSSFPKDITAQTRQNSSVTFSDVSFVLNCSINK